jgi:hypothetical protein
MFVPHWKHTPSRPVARIALLVICRSSYLTGSTSLHGLLRGYLYLLYENVRTSLEAQAFTADAGIALLVICRCSYLTGITSLHGLLRDKGSSFIPVPVRDVIVVHSPRQLQNSQQNEGPATYGAPNNDSFVMNCVTVAQFHGPSGCEHINVSAHEWWPFFTPCVSRNSPLRCNENQCACNLNPPSILPVDTLYLHKAALRR